MTKRKKARKEQRKQNSPAQQAKRAKKNYYDSFAAKEKWTEKKLRRQQRQLNERISRGISDMCPFESWENPSIERCDGCNLKCSFKTRLN